MGQRAAPPGQQRVGALINYRLVDNFEYVIYRAKLARYEMARHELDLERIKRLLVLMEDQEFYKHKGISMRGLVRAALGLLNKRRRSGGSTITQQLIRTLFIVDMHKTFRRKLMELDMALWIESVLDKDALLELYLASVRFENGVYGLPAAMRYFFGRVDTSLNIAKEFVLIERVANIKSRVLGGRIQATLERAVEAGLLTWSDAHDVISTHNDLVRRGLLVEDKPGCLQRLSEHFGQFT